MQMKWGKKTKTINRKIRVRFINSQDNNVLLSLITCMIPRKGDELKLHKKDGKPLLFRVVKLTWVYDEPGCPYDKIDIMVISA
jgi:hypothetical protein